MQLILMVVEAIGLIIGSLAAAVFLCWCLWYAFRLVLHPEWGTSIVLMLLLLAFAGDLPKSQFLDMTLTFAAVAAMPLWFAGRAWRKERPQNLVRPSEQAVAPSPSTAIASTETLLSPRLYPAITACICEERPPTREEIHVVASRLWREGFCATLWEANYAGEFCRATSAGAGRYRSSYRSGPRKYAHAWCCEVLKSCNPKTLPACARDFAKVRTPLHSVGC